MGGVGTMARRTGGIKLNGGGTDLRRRVRRAFVTGIAGTDVGIVGGTSHRNHITSTLYKHRLAKSSMNSVDIEVPIPTPVSRLP